MPVLSHQIVPWLYLECLLGGPGYSCLPTVPISPRQRARDGLGLQSSESWVYKFLVSDRAHLSLRKGGLVARLYIIEMPERLIPLQALLFIHSGLRFSPAICVPISLLLPLSLETVQPRNRAGSFHIQRNIAVDLLSGVGPSKIAADSSGHGFRPHAVTLSIGQLMSKSKG